MAMDVEARTPSPSRPDDELGSQDSVGDTRRHKKSPRVAETAAAEHTAMALSPRGSVRPRSPSGLPAGFPAARHRLPSPGLEAGWGPDQRPSQAQWNPAHGKCCQVMSPTHQRNVLRPSQEQDPTALAEVGHVPAQAGASLATAPQGCPTPTAATATSVVTHAPAATAGMTQPAVTAQALRMAYQHGHSLDTTLAQLQTMYE